MKNIIILVVIIGVAGYFGSKMLLHNKVESGMDNAVLAASPYVDIEYDGVSSTLSGELTVDGIRMTVKGYGDEIRIDRLGIDTPSYFSLLSLADVAQNVQGPDDVIPDYFGFIAEGIHTQADADFMSDLHDARRLQVNADDMDTPAAECTGKYGFSSKAMAGLGYTEQVTSVSAHFRRGQGSYLINISSNIEDMWDMDLELRLSGDMISEFSKGPRYRPRLSEMRLEYKDQSLNERIEKYCRSLGLSDEQILQAQLDGLHFFGKESGIEFDEYVVDPYTDFLRGKSTLVITANPTEPISLSQIELYKPSDVPALLKLTAETY